MTPTARRFARQYLLQALYQWQVSGTPVKELEVQFIEQQIKKKADIDYFKELLHGIITEHQVLDQLMQPFLNRPLPELDLIELAILRLSIYELSNRLDVPYRVIINEALELTKKFGSIEGYKFVNGILDKIARKTRAVELQSRHKNE